MPPQSAPACEFRMFYKGFRSVSAVHLPPAILSLLSAMVPQRSRMVDVYKVFRCFRTEVIPTPGHGRRVRNFADSTAISPRLVNRRFLRSSRVTSLECFPDGFVRNPRVPRLLAKRGWGCEFRRFCKGSRSFSQGAPPPTIPRAHNPSGTRADRPG